MNKDRVITHMLLNGCSISEIARRVDLDRSSLRNRLNRMNIDLTNRTRLPLKYLRSDKKRRLVINMLRNGASNKQVAAVIDANTTKVADLLSSDKELRAARLDYKYKLTN